MRLEKAQKVRAGAQFHRAGAGVPATLTVAFALGQALRALLTLGSAGEGTDLQFYQPLGRKADHLAQQIGIF